MKTLFITIMMFLLTPLFLYSVNLESASTFGGLAGSTITNIGMTIIHGNLGVSPGTSISGFPPGDIIDGMVFLNDPVAITAQADALAAYNDILTLPVTADLSGINLGGLTLTPGVYFFSTSAQLTGTLNLDASGDPAGAFVFQIGSTLTTDVMSLVTLVNGASPSNIFWQVGDSATLGENSVFEGNILANSNISVNAGASVAGSLLAINGALTLNDNIIRTAPPSSVPLLVITKTHFPETFIVEKQGVYTVTVGNIGTISTSGTITVTDTLPTGLTAIEGSGTGWSFNIVGQVVTATTNSTIAVGDQAPPISLLVTVDSGLDPVLTNLATAGGGGSVTVSISDVTAILPLAPPTHFTGKVVKIKFPTQTDIVNKLQWTPSTYSSVVSYLLFRNNTLISTISGTGPFKYEDHNRHKHTPYVYTLVAVDSNGFHSASTTVTVP
jgi:uncharacterized repeat protein (TIGR01451 family)